MRAIREDSSNLESQSYTWQLALVIVDLHSTGSAKRCKRTWLNGKVLSVLGNVQFDPQKLVDSYRSHVILTITTPSESLLNELRTVEEGLSWSPCHRLDTLTTSVCYDDGILMNLYSMSFLLFVGTGDEKAVRRKKKEKGKSKSGKMEVCTSQELQAARDEYDEEATLCVFRLKSLKQGQCRSLLTQAARHHAAQLNLFRKGLKFLEAVEPHRRLVTEKQHIDYQLSGLDDGEDRENEGVNSLQTNDDGELSFDYRQNKQGLDAVSTSRNSMEVNLNRSVGEQNFNREHRVGSHSAPIFAEKKFDPAERAREMQPSARKFHSYVLPTPVDVKSSISITNGSDLQLRPTSHIGSTHSLWHSSPLEPEKREKDCTDDNLSVPAISKAQLKLKESSSNNPSVQDPPNSASGTLTSTISPITSSELPQLVSGLLSRVHTLRPSSSPKVSPSASPPIVSSPKISELHELPRPPGGLTSKPVSSSIRHSAPLIFRNQENRFSSTDTKLLSNVSEVAPHSGQIEEIHMGTIAMEVHAVKEIRKCGYYLHLLMTTRAKSTRVRRIIMLVSEQNERSSDAVMRVTLCSDAAMHVSLCNDAVMHVTF
ncbi:hypothetical protein TEA_017791 [Camellia sinensis var. sinensis]|uniref:Uncharacterized protein n=1 Tax=Camellia sinensis var. sinensis TaxID=542762 RepID=A0A4S4D8D5_CAMSN|nr:hypothetical protein TEA_017791 [Camellia sinensis var. sinensis]